MREISRHCTERNLRGFLFKSKLRSLLLLTSLLIVIVGSCFIGIMVTRAASYCQVTYTVTNQWSGGFGANITIQNTSPSAWTHWNLAFTFPSQGQTVTQLWDGTVSQTGQNVTVANASYNGNVAVNAFVNPGPGFTGSWSASNPVPTSFTINGNACGQSTTMPPTSSPTQGTTPTTTAPPGSTTSTSTPRPGTHVDNPYAGAQGYINPDWAAEVKAGAAAVGGSLGAKEAKVAQYSTAVWLDRIAAVTGGSGITRTLAGHLDAAERQASTGSKPIVMTIVIYDLPDRDCAALASNGELSIANNGLAAYETRYIDVIAAQLRQAKYRNLRIAAVIEPDSLPNLVTNLGIGRCDAANSSGVYVQGIQYALNKLHAIANVYTYLDIAHDGWLGWNTNFQAVVALITRTIKGTTAGLNSVDGFISNTANYVPTTEPYLTASQSVGGSQVRNASFYQSNTYIDEATYDTAMRNAFISAGFPNSIGMLIDTSRNGWGGAARPAGPSAATDLNTFVTATRIDRRLSRGNWCNQSSGIGARPVANPAPGFDAYVWIKPPGESDGSSQAVANTQGKGFDRMCDPTYTGNMMNNNNLTGAMPNAPLAGQWFQAGFNTLVQNADPSL